MVLTSIRLCQLFLKGSACRTAIAPCNWSRHSSTASGASTVTIPDDGATCKVQPFFYNRNPRNLEKMTIARKPIGYALDDVKIQFWNKLVVKSSGRSITAEVVHHTGVSVISASTSEHGLRKSLYRANDLCAHRALGKVIAQRCLESGIDFVFFDSTPIKKAKLDALLTEVKEAGLSVGEPPVYRHPGFWSKFKPLKPWEILE